MCLTRKETASKCLDIFVFENTLDKPWSEKNLIITVMSYKCFPFSKTKKELLIVEDNFSATGLSENADKNRNSNQFPSV